MKSVKVKFNLKHRANRKQIKHIKTKKSSFPKEQVGNTHLDKPVMTKIMTRHDEHIK